MNSTNCIGVILAGGKSARMGKPKGLLDFFGSFWLEDQLRRLKLGGIKTVYIGLGYDSNEYFKAIKSKLLKVPIITPAFKDYKNGQY